MSSAGARTLRFAAFSSSSTTRRQEVGSHALMPNGGGKRTCVVPSASSCCIATPRLPHKSLISAYQFNASCASTAGRNCSSGATSTTGPFSSPSTLCKADVGNHAVADVGGGKRTWDVPSAGSSCKTRPRWPQIPAKRSSHFKAGCCSTAGRSSAMEATCTSRRSSGLTRPCCFAMASMLGSCINMLSSWPWPWPSASLESNHFENHSCRSRLPGSRSLGGPSPKKAISERSSSRVACASTAEPFSDCRVMASTRSRRAASYLNSAAFARSSPARSAMAE
mmetsp:Transcript_54718/g.108079  ORF Transcript_54718/g.108079 Transcript_54718/m.108079 type:complete len:280 (-) Transcript_54718:513-1352(-)